MNFKRLSTSVIHLDSVDSTNNYAAGLLKTSKPVNGTVIVAKKQAKGKGQRGNTWVAEDGKNLILSIILYPGIKADKAFALNMAAALGVQKTLARYVKDVKIKWPNDILAGTYKVCGILVENQVRGTEIASSVIGIGINVNQQHFEGLPNASSLKLISGDDFQLSTLLDELLSNIDFYTNLLMEKNFAALAARYHEQLYGINRLLPFEDQDGHFEGVIRGIDENGKLLVNCNGDLVRYDLKEIRFL